MVSSERFSRSLPPRNIAELRGSPPLRGSLEQLDRSSPAGPLLQETEKATLSTPEASLEILVPLVGHLAVWKPLSSMSLWVLPEQTLALSDSRSRFKVLFVPLKYRSGPLNGQCN